MFDWLVMHVWIIPALPLAAAALIAALGPKVLRERSHWPAVSASVLACLLALLLLAHVASSPSASSAGRTLPEDGVHADSAPGDAGWPVVLVYEWIDVADFRAPVQLRVDPLTSLMLVMVTFVGTLIVVYSIGYMHDDPSYWRFFAAVSLFLFSMTGLVLASNLLLIYVFWELVGLCSYLLIGFWYGRPEAAAAAKKAFLVNRIGDFGFALGLLLVWVTFRTLDFDETFARAGDVSTAVITVICLLLFCGAVGKSAQFPLHVWLPDAMEGPTPVSALIHAATMVTAGVYMVARFTPLFALSPVAQAVVALIGGVTALLAALIALTQTDLKRILAYSTISQLGYMFLGLGCGTAAAVVAGIFHVFTHAFFKALLFLGAGSVMHAMGGVIDIRRLGGLSRRLPITHATFACGAAALAGIPLLSGFWSKDAIVAAVGDAAEGDFGLLYQLLFVVALVTAALTAFYTFRAYFQVFWGEERIPEEAGDHAHESPSVMTYPLIVLAIFSLGIGALLATTVEGLNVFLDATPGLAGAHAEHGYGIMVVSGAIALVGVVVAWFMYGRSSDLPDVLAQRMKSAYELSRAKFYLDEVYHAVVVRPTLIVAELSRLVDIWIVDGLVRLVSNLPGWVGRMALRPMQNGLVQFYALAMICCLAVLLLAVWLRG